VAYVVIEEPCPDCFGAGGLSDTYWTAGGEPAERFTPCNRCLTSGWVEVYAQQATAEAVEVSDRPDAESVRG